MILFVIFVDICYNILPALKDANGNPLPFLSLNLLWAVTSVVGDRRHLRLGLPAQLRDDEADPDPRPADRRMPQPP